MKTGHVYFAVKIDAAVLAGWLGTWFTEDAFRLGMRADATDLSCFQPGQAAGELAAWSQGRIFNQDFEVRWEQRGEHYAVWVLYEADPTPPDSFDESPPEGFEACGDSWTVAPGRQPKLYLWGRYDRPWTEGKAKGKPTWIEVRIPRPLHHPTDPPEEAAPDQSNTRALFAQLGHVEYRAPNGAVQFTRLTEVI